MSPTASDWLFSFPGLTFVIIKLAGYTAFCGFLRMAYRAEFAAVCRIRHGVIDSDWSCHVCEYNLRTMPAAGRCPECGTKIQLVSTTLPGFAERSAWTQPFRLAFVRTALGVGLGIFFWNAIQPLFSGWRGIILVYVILLGFLRGAEWLLVIWMFVDRRRRYPMVGLRWAGYGVLCSYALDLPAIAAMWLTWLSGR